MRAGAGRDGVLGAAGGAQGACAGWRAFVPDRLPRGSQEVGLRFSAPPAPASSVGPCTARQTQHHAVRHPRCPQHRLWRPRCRAGEVWAREEAGAAGRRPQGPGRGAPGRVQRPLAGPGAAQGLGWAPQGRPRQRRQAGGKPSHTRVACCYPVLVVPRRPAGRVSLCRPPALCGSPALRRPRTSMAPCPATSALVSLPVPPADRRSDALMDGQQQQPIEQR